MVVDDQTSAKGVFVVGISHADLLKAGRVVKLACGHFTLTKALRKAGCPRCGEMVRAGYDYDGFRRLVSRMRFRGPMIRFGRCMRLWKAGHKGAAQYCFEPQSHAAP